MAIVLARLACGLGSGSGLGKGLELESGVGSRVWPGLARFGCGLGSGLGLESGVGLGFRPYLDANRTHNT